MGRPPKGPLDKVRTILWFWAIAEKLDVSSAYAIEIYYFENTVGSDKDFVSTGKFNKYKAGKHLPSEDLIAWFEARFKGTRVWLDHPFWDIAIPSTDIEMLYEHLTSLRPEISQLLFYTNGETKRNIPIRRGMKSTDELSELDVESDFDALSASLGLLQEVRLLDRNPDISLHRLIALRILSRSIAQFPTLEIMPELFSYLRQHFLNDLENQEWSKELDSISFDNCRMENSLILSIIKDANILKYFNTPPPRCLYYGQFHLTTEEIFKLWNYRYDEDTEKIKNHPSIRELTTQIKRWERSSLKNNSITQYSGLKSRPVNTSVLVS